MLQRQSAKRKKLYGDAVSFVWMLQHSVASKHRTALGSAVRHEQCQQLLRHLRVTRADLLHWRMIGCVQQNVRTISRLCASRAPAHTYRDMPVTILTVRSAFTSHTNQAVFPDSRNVFVSDDRHIISDIDVPASDITLCLPFPSFRLSSHSFLSTVLLSLEPLGSPMYLSGALSLFTPLANETQAAVTGSSPINH
jgi:hypothetical protein